MFKKKSKNTRLDLIPPSGLFVRTPAMKIFFSKAGGLFEVSEIHFPSWNAEALPVLPLALKDLPIKGKLGFRDGTLVKDFVGGRIYLISDSKKRLIADPGALAQLGGEQSVITVPSWAIELHMDGEEIGSS
jgi:hypothetical protein